MYSFSSARYLFPPIPVNPTLYPAVHVNVLHIGPLWRIRTEEKNTPKKHIRILIESDLIPKKKKHKVPTLNSLRVSGWSMTGFVDFDDHH